MLGVGDTDLRRRNPLDLQMKAQAILNPNLFAEQREHRDARLWMVVVGEE